MINHSVLKGFALLLTLLALLSLFAACGNGNGTTSAPAGESSSQTAAQTSGETVEEIDYAGQLKLDMSSSTKKQEASGLYQFA